MFPYGAPGSSPLRNRRPPCWPPARMWWRAPSSSSGASFVTLELAIDTARFVCYEQACSDWRDMKGKVLTYALRMERARQDFFSWIRPRKEVQRGGSRDHREGVIAQHLVTNEEEEVNGGSRRKLD